LNLLHLLIQRFAKGEPFHDSVNDLIADSSYSKKIGTPEDFRNIREKLMVGNYQNPSEFGDDVRQLFLNTKPTSQVI